LTLSKTSWETQEFSGIAHARCVDRLVRVGNVPPSDLPRVTKVVVDGVIDPICGLVEAGQGEVSDVANPPLPRRISAPAIVWVTVTSIDAGLEVVETIVITITIHEYGRVWVVVGVVGGERAS
jgi:hypothetical protein